ncbi:CTLH/CRA C-terminal to lish motif domain-containing protein [Blastocladiella britannica]|nr:CTLH/CRA C-terminal to lish motif domain-containing protein [Blastocladiella britannica]
MDAITPEFDKFADRVPSRATETAAALDDLMALLRSTRRDLEPLEPEKRKKVLFGTAALVKAKTASIIDSAKDAATVLGKCSKAIDKKFGTAAVESEWNPHAFEQKQETLRVILGQHFVRQGNEELARVFQREAGLNSLETADAQFNDLHHLVHCIRAWDLAPVIAWAQEKRFELRRIDSTLEFDLHRVMYLQLLSRASTNPQALKAALDYARTNFSAFPENAPVIQKLMAAILYAVPGKSLPPRYADSAALTASSATALERQFARDFCTLLGLSPDSPLLTTVQVGTTALPIISKMAAIMKDTKNEWSAVHELPVEVPMLARHQYHSIFACPVSREQGTEQNPPMMLPCGHTICNESLKRLSSGGVRRFKCPYCPAEVAPGSAMRVHL